MSVPLVGRGFVAEQDAAEQDAAWLERCGALRGAAVALRGMDALRAAPGIAVHRQGACFKSEINNWRKLQTASGGFNIFI